MEALESFVYCLLRMYVKIPVKMHPFDLLTKFHKSYVCFMAKIKNGVKIYCSFYKFLTQNKIREQLTENYQGNNQRKYSFMTFLAETLFSNQY